VLWLALAVLLAAASLVWSALAVPWTPAGTPSAAFAAARRAPDGLRRPPPPPDNTSECAPAGASQRAGSPAAAAATGAPPPPPAGPQRSTPDANGECCVEADGARACVRAGTRLAFRDNLFCERGTSAAIFDYMDAWERLACGEAWFSAQDSDALCAKYNGVSSAPRFRARFGAHREFVTDREW
jgi:hypothetical protein